MLDVLITLLILVVIFAVIAYVLNSFIPMEPQLRQLVFIILGVILLIWLLLALFGQAPVWRMRGSP